MSYYRANMSLLSSHLRPALAAACLLLVTGTSSPAHAQLDCSNNAELSQLDFWIGEWRVVDEAGQVLGRDTIFRLLNGCVIQEQWLGSQGGIGISLFYVSPQSGKLTQVWVTGQALAAGGTKEKAVTAFEHGESVVFEGSYPAGDATIFDRTTLTRQENGDVHQLIEISRDQGETWERAFLGIYTRP